MTAFVLILLIVFPGEGRPPAMATKSAVTLEACQQQAAEFLKQDPKDFGAEALIAGCRKNTEPGDPA